MENDCFDQVLRYIIVLWCFRLWQQESASSYAAPLPPHDLLWPLRSNQKLAKHQNNRSTSGLFLPYKCLFPYLKPSHLSHLSFWVICYIDWVTYFWWPSFPVTLSFYVIIFQFAGGRDKFEHYKCFSQRVEDGQSRVCHSARLEMTYMLFVRFTHFHMIFQIHKESSRMILHMAIWQRT